MPTNIFSNFVTHIWRLVRTLTIVAFCHCFYLGHQKLLIWLSSLWFFVVVCVVIIVWLTLTVLFRGSHIWWFRSNHPSAKQYLKFHVKNHLQNYSLVNEMRNTTKSNQIYSIVCIWKSIIRFNRIKIAVERAIHFNRLIVELYFLNIHEDRCQNQTVNK